MNPRWVMVVAIFLAACGQVVMKYGLRQINYGDIQFNSIVFFLRLAFLNPLVLLGFSLYGISSVLWLVVIHKVELSFAYPMLAGSYVLVALLSWLVFAESLSSTRMMGLGVIAVGVMILSRS